MSRPACSGSGSPSGNRSERRRLETRPIRGFATLREIVFFLVARRLSTASATRRSLPGLQRHPSPVRPRQPPLVREPPGVLIQQFPGIDPIAGKRPAAEMVNEQVMGHGQLKPGPPRPFGEVIVIKEPQPNRSSSPPIAS